MRPLFSFLSSLVVLLVLALAPMGIGCTSTANQSASTTASDTSSLLAGGSAALLPGSTTTVESDVPYIRTPKGVVDTMLQIASVTADDVVYDLGSGDGRIPIWAAKKYGARGVGIEIKPSLVTEARANAEKAGVDDRVEFRQGDLFKADLSDATVVTLYLVPGVNLKVRSKLFQELSPGTRVVSHDFDMGQWAPDTVWTSANGDTVYRWTIPETPPSFVDLEGE